MGKWYCHSAVAVVRGENGIRGNVRIVPQSGGSLVIAEIRGLPASESGFFALHIHENGDCRGKGFPDTGGHYNPVFRPHPAHAGDLPPLLSCGGRAYMKVLTDRFSVRDVIGRSVVIHDKADDFTTQPAGNAGNKIACGVIRWSRSR